ncbi:Homoaconitase, partial [Colletotrichum shisoi]
MPSIPKSKPALPRPTSSFPKPVSRIHNPQTMAEKIVQRYAVGLADGKKVRAGDYVTIKPAACMSHDNSFPISKKFMGLGADKIYDPRQIVMTMVDHDVQNLSEANLKNYRLIQEFAKKHGVDQLPPVARIHLRGILPPGVNGKDVIVALCGLFNKDEVLNHAIEFTGSEETMRSLSIDERLTISNMSTEHGALSAIFPIDSTLKAWLRSKATFAAVMSPDGKAYSRWSHERIDSLFENPPTSDHGATYANTLYMDLSTLSPFVAGPNSVKVATPLKDLEAQDIKSLSPPDVDPVSASAKVFWSLNFKGRMGSAEAKAYLASPEVVAASALQGKIAGPGWYQKPDGVDKVIIGEGAGDMTADIATSIEDALEELIFQADGIIAESEKDLLGVSAGEVAVAESEEKLTDVLPGFPEKIEGEIVFCDADNLNTDGIYPGKYTYQDDVSVEKMAEAGDILVSGFNFGTGSSREQAATAILAKKIPLVVAGSFGNIFSRSSINNALMGVEVPKLVQRLRETLKEEGDKKVLARRTGWKLLWDVRRSKVTVTEKGGETWKVKLGELPLNVQEIIARGGLEEWVKAEIT